MKLNESQQELASEATGRAQRIAAWYARRYPAHEADICSAAQLAVVRAAASYTPDPNRVWARWSRIRVRRQIRRYLDSREVRDAPESDEIALRATIDGRSGESLEEILEPIPDPRRSLCRLIYGSGMSPGEAAKKIGYSARWGRWSHSEAIKQLKDHYKEHYRETKHHCPPLPDG